MTIKRGAPEEVVKIRASMPMPRFWIWNIVGALAGLAFVDSALKHGRPWFALPWLAVFVGNVAVGFAVRNFGLDLTAEFAMVRGLRRRKVPWPSVQAVARHQQFGGWGVRLILDSGESVKLIFPKRGHKDDAHYERDFQRIEEWWLTHRGESWRPVSSSAPQPPVQGQG